MKKQWIRLDNAAKIFPPAVYRSNTQVFRMSCELDTPIQPELLQQALDATAEDFPLYRYILRRGFFWYYLENTDLTNQVHLEDKPPCSPIYRKGKKRLLYDVSYYHTRINLEVFHALSDGTGAAFFLKTLVNKYLALVEKRQEPPLNIDASHSQMLDDSFKKYYSNEKRHKAPRLPNAFKIKGFKHSEYRMRLISGTMPVDQLRRAAKQHDASITQFLCAVLMKAIHTTIPLRTKKPVVLSVPVNLRNIFPSASARNFFGVLNTSYDFSSGEHDLEQILLKVKQDFAENLTEERLADHMNNYTAIERNFAARIVPLFLKDFFMKLAYQLSHKKITAAISNVGILEMPEECSSIDSFYLFASTDSLQACVCSYKDRLTVNFSSIFVSTEAQKQFFRQLVQFDIPVELTSNQIDADE